MKNSRLLLPLFIDGNLQYLYWKKVLGSPVPVLGIVLGSLVPVLGKVLGSPVPLLGKVLGSPVPVLGKGLRFSST